MKFNFLTFIFSDNLVVYILLVSGISTLILIGGFFVRRRISQPTNFDTNQETTGKQHALMSFYRA